MITEIRFSLSVAVSQMNPLHLLPSYVTLTSQYKDIVFRKDCFDFQFDITHLVKVARLITSQDKFYKRWIFLVGIVVIILLLSGCAAQQPEVYRVGILSGIDVFASTADGYRRIKAANQLQSRSRIGP